ncbi:type II toxin-antitoxin system RelE/ParE family toxin [Escherichia coli]
MLHFVETLVFERLVDELLTPDDFAKFQAYLIANPEAGDRIERTGGCRKIRWALPGKGKSGGVRAIYYYLSELGEIYLLYVYPKSVRDDLTEKQKAAMKKLALMIKAG